MEMTKCGCDLVYSTGCLAVVKGGGDLDNHPSALTCLNNAVLVDSPIQSHMDKS